MTRRDRTIGVALLEVVFVAGLVSLSLALSVGATSTYRARSRNLGAARLLVGQLRLARALAVREGVHVGLVFERDATGDHRFRLHLDGNGNGLRLADVRRGVDPPVSAATRLSDVFGGTVVRIDRAVPAVDTNTPLSVGSNPVRLSGGSTVLSCGPTGTTTAGTVYVSGAGAAVFAIRTLGATGRLRLLEFSDAQGTWLERW